MANENLHNPLEWEVIVREDPRVAEFDPEMAFNVATYISMVEAAEEIVVATEVVAEAQAHQLTDQAETYLRLYDGDPDALSDSFNKNIIKIIMRSVKNEKDLDALAFVAVTNPRRLGLRQE